MRDQDKIALHGGKNCLFEKARKMLYFLKRLVTKGIQITKQGSKGQLLQPLNTDKVQCVQNASNTYRKIIKQLNQL